MASEMDLKEISDEANMGYTNPTVKYDPGLIAETDLGYRFNDYFATEAGLFVILPLMGADLYVEREENQDDIKKAKGSMLNLKVICKGIYPIKKSEFYIGAGAGYSWLYKSVNAEDEGMSFSGMSYHAVIGYDYITKEKISMGGYVEYMVNNYNSFDFWLDELVESSKGKKLTQNIIVIGFRTTFRFF